MRAASCVLSLTPRKTCSSSQESSTRSSVLSRPGNGAHEGLGADGELAPAASHGVQAGIRGNAVQEARGIAGIQAGPVAKHLDEGLLHGVCGKVLIPQHPPAPAQHHGPVPAVQVFHVNGFTFSRFIHDFLAPVTPTVGRGGFPSHHQNVGFGRRKKCGPRCRREAARRQAGSSWEAELDVRAGVDQIQSQEGRLR